ncbi:MAG TPA: CPBP family intramembrane glutamic endopeptidase [Myxococcota bacterium]
MRLRAFARALAGAAVFALALAAWGAVRARLPDDAAATLAADALATAVLLALLAAAGAALAAEPASARLGLRRGRLGAGASALGALGLLGLSHAIDGALTLAGAPPSVTLGRFEAALGSAGAGELLLALAALALAAAGAEELFFRGLLQRGFERRLGPAAAIGLAAALFATAHGDLVHAAAAFPLGVYLGVLARLDGSIRAAFAAHALNNAVAVLETAARLEGPAGGAALASIGVGLAVAAVALWGARTRVRPRAEPEPAAPAAP